VRTRDAAADADFVEFVRGRTPALLRSAYLMTGDQQHAEDLVQSALARTYLAWGRVAGLGSAEAYTRKVMYHLQVDRWRRKRFAEAPYEAIEVDPVTKASDATDGAAARLDVARALARLTTKQRAVLVLRYFDDRTEADTAAVLGCSVGTVKSQTAKALARLRVLCPELAPAVSAQRANDGGGADR
jgi:RNA polymerase sigma-70 factor (sigma-E family)